MKITILFSFIVLFLCLVIPPLAIRNRLDLDVPSDHPIPITKTMVTAYTPSHDQINIIRLRLKNSRLIDTGQYRLSLLDSSGDVIKAVDFSGRNVGDPSDLRLQFPPLQNSLAITSIELKPLSSDPQLQVYIDSSDNISFTAYYREPGGLKWPNLSFISADLGFFFIWFGILVGIVWAEKHFS